jgi:hypothetical protein
VTRKLAPVAVAAVAALASTPAVHAARAGQLCKPFKLAGLTYRWETVGSGWTCASAKPWVVKLSADRVRSSGSNVPLTNGPKGFHCYATLTHKGRASGGLCYKGTLAFPKSGFTWNGT